MAVSEDQDSKLSSKLDMSHGFVHHIIKNQVERNDYDKEVKLAKTYQKGPRLTPSTNRPKKPNIRLYTPPSRGTKTGDDDTETEELFKLEYVSDSGIKSEFVVRKGDNAHDLAVNYAPRLGLDSALTEALEIRIDEEMRRREET